jgi:hypothetical protein
MSLSITGLSQLKRAMQTTPQTIGKASQKGIQNALEIWAEETRRDALIDTGHLQDEIKVVNPVASVFSSGVMVGEIYDNAYAGDKGSKTGKHILFSHRDFNYALYWYERGEEGWSPKKGIGYGNHFEVAFDTVNAQLKDAIESEIESALRAKGW